MKILFPFIICICAFAVPEISTMSMPRADDIVSSNVDGILGLLRVSNAFLEVAKQKMDLKDVFSFIEIMVRDLLQTVLKIFPTNKSIRKLCFNINKIHEDGYTFLMLESYRGNIKAVQFLLALKADVNAAAKNGETALILASMAGHDQIVELLLKHNAKLDQTLDYGINALMIAAMKGYEKIVQMFLQNAVDINTDVTEKHKALTLAVYQNHTRVVRLFLEHSSIKNLKLGDHGLSQFLLIASDPTIVDLLLNYISDGLAIEQGVRMAFSKHQHSALEVYFKYFKVDLLKVGNSSLLLYAAYLDDTENMKFLLEHKANVNQVHPPTESTPLMIAAMNGHVSSVNLLLKYKANVNYSPNEGLTALIFAINKRDAKIVELLLQHKSKVDIMIKGVLPAFTFATSNSSKKIVELLLTYGADVDQLSKGGYTALMIAAEKGLDDIIELLLKHKANVHMKDFEYERNALMFASHEGHYNTAKLLLQHGAMVDDVNIFGYTSLMAAAERGHDLVIELLLNHGADVNKVHMRRVNALMVAAYMGHLTTVKLLLKHNASTSQINEFGQTALDMALLQNRTEIVELLRQYTVPQDVSNHEISNQQMSPETAHSISPDKVTSSNTLTLMRANEDDYLLWSYNHFFLQLLLFTLILLVISTYFIQKYTRLYSISNNKYEEKILSLLMCLWKFFHNVTMTPLLLQNVWECDTAVPPFKSGFFRLLNFQERINCATYVQEMSPNCAGCVVTSVRKTEKLHKNEMYMECCLIQEYMKTIVKFIQEKHIVDNQGTDPEDANLRTFFNLSAEVGIVIKSILRSSNNVVKIEHLQQFEHLKTKLAKFTENNSTLMKKLRSTFTDSSVKTTEPKLICSLFGLDELFESYLLQLDISSIRHQSLDFYIQRWLKTTVQAIEETDQSASLYECMLRIGLSQEMASTYLENLSQEFINMYSSLYWLSRYFKNLASVNPLITNLPRSCVFDGEMGVWESQELRRDGQTFTIHVLNEKSFPIHDRHGRDLTCDRINRYLKKKKSADYIYLYHGTSLASAEKIVVTRGIDLRQGSKNLDFSHGTGFYVINYLPKCIEWSSNARPENHAVIIYKVSKTAMEKRNGLILDNEEQWGRVIKACRSGFKGEIGSEVEDELEEYEYVRGYICSNGRAIEKDAAVPLQVMQEIVEGDVPSRPLQTCILKKKCAVWFNSNIFGVVVYRTH